MKILKSVQVYTVQCCSISSSSSVAAALAAVAAAIAAAVATTLEAASVWKQDYNCP